jgi:hypothetical protein
MSAMEPKNQYSEHEENGKKITRAKYDDPEMKTRRGNNDRRDRRGAGQRSLNPGVHWLSGHVRALWALPKREEENRAHAVELRHCFWAILCC